MANPYIPSITPAELKELAQAINQQITDLLHSVGEVKHLLHLEARRMKKATGPAKRAFSRSKGDPITVLHGPQGATTLQGHPTLGDPPASEGGTHPRPTQQGSGSKSAVR